MWAFDSVFYHIYPLGLCGAPRENDGVTVNRIQKLADWFEEWTKSRYGGCTCREILEGDPGNKMKRCPELVEEVYQKCLELLSEKGGLP